MRSSLIFTIGKKFIWSLLVFVPLYSFAELASSEEILTKLNQCRAEASALARLDCYDQAWTADDISSPDNKLKGGPAWNRAMNQESARTDHSVSLLTKINNADSNNPSVIITTPALGYKPPRPVLMFSCIDNITRLQIALLNPVDKRDTNVDVVTDKTHFGTRWFFRENGFLLEASRGLEGISEIQRLFKANTLKINSGIASINGLTFNIEQLENELKPLRTACHW